MKELDLLKKNWEQISFKPYSEKELFMMTKRKSVSIAKWVFIIALCEIGFWVGLEYLIPEFEENKKIHPWEDTIINTLSFISYCLPFVFLGILIYLNHKIRNTKSPKILMGYILMMRNTMIWYIRLFLGQFLILPILYIILKTLSAYNNGENTDMGRDLFEIFFVGMLLFFFTAIFILFLRFIYHLIYGRLLKKLKENYEELSKIETEKEQ